MKLTKQQLQKIIKEELSDVLLNETNEYEKMDALEEIDFGHKNLMKIEELLENLERGMTGATPEQISKAVSLAAVKIKGKTQMALSALEKVWEYIENLEITGEDLLDRGPHHFSDKYTTMKSVETGEYNQ
tara:strand:+ start:328 stop:717 length:390 start_codon:yes stop_codon:yes gene_type:complete